MSTLNELFTDENLKNLCDRLQILQRNTIDHDVRNNANEKEIELLDTIDHLCRVSNMLNMVLAQLLDGDIQIGDPGKYISGKLSIAEASLVNYLKSNKLEYE